jgi:ABC-type multidrug transport system ATPase subunit
LFEITLEACGKKFNRNWVFKEFSHTFTSGNAYAILGPNGSGKSTLLQCIAGYMAISKGKIVFTNSGTIVEEDQKYKHLTLSSPFLELIEEFTLRETVDFHFRMKKPLNGITPKEIIDITGLQASADKQLKFFSSGMKQRVKIALAVFSDVPVLMLDEPCTNFDTKAVDWYLNLIETHTKNRLVLVASNQPNEYGFCTEVINVA